MKKLLSFACTLLLLLACGGGDDAGGGGATGGSEYLNVGNVEIPGGNTTATLSIQASNNCDWVISWSEPWIRSISPTSGRGSNNVTITVTVNPSSSAERTALVTVKNANGSITRNVTITQSPNVENLELSINSMNFTNSVGSQEVSVTSNTHWTVSGVASWMSLNKSEGDNDGVVRITVEANKTESERVAVLVFKGAGGAEQKLTVTQAGLSGNFTVSPTNITAEATANSVNFIISGETKWTAQSSSSWATLSDVAGEGNKTIFVTLADNMTESSRTAEVTVSSASKTEKVIIVQSAGSKPVITDLKASDITDVDQNKATLTFSYSSMFTVTECGLCYSPTNENPLIGNSTHIPQSAASTQHKASIEITGLSAGTTYYVRAYANSAVGTQYSNVITFTTVNDWPGGGDNVTPGL